MTKSTIRAATAPARPGWLAVGLLRLYPRGWRERYGEELLELLTAQPMSLVGVLATLRAALDAHLNLPDLVSSWGDGTARLRWSITVTLTAWAAFCLAAAGVAKSLEDPAFPQAVDGHPALAATHALASIAFLLAASAVAGGGLPLLGSAAAQAVRRRDRAALGLLTVPLAAGVLPIGFTALLGRLHPGPVLSAGTVGLAVGWAALVLASATAAVRAVGALIAATDVPPAMLRLAGWASVVAAAAMTTGVLAGAGYGLAVRLTAPSLFYSRNGVLATPLPVTWAAALLLAAAAVAVADRAAVRAVRALRTAA